MADDIQPVTSLPMKRKKADLNFQLCILCQLNKTESLSNGTQQGTNRIEESTEIRAACKDSSYSDIIYLLSPYIANLLDNKPRWHKSCYATFTSKVNLQSIQERSSKEENTYALGPSTSSKVAWRDILYKMLTGQSASSVKRGEKLKMYIRFSQ